MNRILRLSAAMFACCAASVPAGFGQGRARTVPLANLKITAPGAPGARVSLAPAAAIATPNSATPRLIRQVSADASRESLAIPKRELLLPARAVARPSINSQMALHLNQAIQRPTAGGLERTLGQILKTGAGATDPRSNTALDALYHNGSTLRFSADDNSANAVPGSSLVIPPNVRFPLDKTITWDDRFTGDPRETEFSKVAKVVGREGARLRSPSANGLYERLTAKPKYGAEAYWNAGYDARAWGTALTNPWTIVTRNLLQLSPTFILARIAETWAYFYFDNVPTSANKTYMALSTFVKTFIEHARNSGYPNTHEYSWPSEIDKKDGLGQNVTAAYFDLWNRGHRTSDSDPRLIEDGALFQAIRFDNAVNADGDGRKTLEELYYQGKISWQQLVDARKQWIEFIESERIWRANNLGR